MNCRLSCARKFRLEGILHRRHSLSLLASSDSPAQLVDMVQSLLTAHGTPDLTLARRALHVHAHRGACALFHVLAAACAPAAPPPPPLLTAPETLAWCTDAELAQVRAAMAASGRGREEARKGREGGREDLIGVFQVKFDGGQDAWREVKRGSTCRGEPCVLMQR